MIRKDMMKRCLFLLVVATLISCSQIEREPNKEDLEVAIKTFNEAFETADVTTLAQMITVNYAHTNGSWESFGKEKWLEYMRARKTRIERGGLRMDTYEMRDLHIEMYGSSAFVTGKFLLEGEEDGEAFTKEVRISNFWVVEDGVWKRAGFHDTSIENPVP